MGKNSASGCIKEKRGLHVCQKSILISKNVPCNARVYQKVEDIFNTTPSNMDVKTKSQDSEEHCRVINHDMASGEQIFLEQLSFLAETMPINLDSARSSCKIQAFNVSDFCISDLAFSEPLPLPPVDAAFPYDYEREESSLMRLLKQDYMILPFLEDVLDSESDSDGGHSDETFIDAENSNPQMYIKMQPNQHDLTCTMLPSPAQSKNLDVKRITLVLDLDETLVHSTLDSRVDADFKFSVFFNEKEHVVYVKQRPHLQTFLKRVAEMFEIVVFTASQSIYAKQILDTLDPDGTIISRRAYRDSCIFSEGTYVKDLTIFGLDLAKVAIVDNTPQVFRLQVDNGIPIKSWFDDPSDSALMSLLPFLESLVDTDDVRPLIAKKFGNRE